MRWYVEPSGASVAIFTTTWARAGSVPARRSASVERRSRAEAAFELR
jgi:hypothetical protein